MVVTDGVDGNDWAADGGGDNDDYNGNDNDDGFVGHKIPEYCIRL